jgi:hypothetical protein
MKPLKILFATMPLDGHRLSDEFHSYSPNLLCEQYIAEVMRRHEAKTPRRVVETA